MKRKLIACMLSLTLISTSFAVYAEEAAEPAAEEAADQEEAEEEAAEAASDSKEEAAETTDDEAADEDAADEDVDAADEDGEDEEDLDRYNELTVAGTTPFNGAFFTKMWGSAVSDLDVQGLIHGYNLVEWRSEEGVFRVDPSVVSGITVTENADGDRTYTLTIYDDLFYNDGTPITAADYAFSMLLSIAPEVEAIGGTVKNAEYLLGYAEYRNGTVPYLAGVRILDTNMLSITVSREYLPFFYELALLDCTPYPISVIAPGCAVNDDGQGVYIANEDPEVTEPVFTAELLEETILDPEEGYLTHPSVTSGPYTMLSFDGEKAEFELNTYYKGNSDGIQPTIPRLIYQVETNETMMEDWEKGDVELLNKTVSAETIQQGLDLIADNREERTMTNYTRSGMSFISFCCERELVSTEKMRQAIALCLDKDALVDEYVGNYGLRVDGYYGLGQWMYQLINGTMPYPVEEPQEGSTAEDEAYEAELQAWQELSLEDVKVYDLDVEAAADLFAKDGWTLNQDGDPFDPEKDEIRCKYLNGELTSLELTMMVPEETHIAEVLQENFADHLAEAGAKLTITETDSQTLLNTYYRLTERDCDMIYLATNFDVVFDPSAHFRPEEAEEETAEETEEEAADDTEEAEEDANGEPAVQNVYNTTGIDDEQLYQLAVDMRRTEPGDTLTYCQKWIEFQKRFAEVMPMIPIYSNVYFDFYPRYLQNYHISENITWSQAIVFASLSDASDEELEEEVDLDINVREGSTGAEEEEEDDNLIEIDD